MTVMQIFLLAIVTIIAVYVISRIQATAWLHTIEKFLNNKHSNLIKTKENEQEQSKKN